MTSHDTVSGIGAVVKVVDSHLCGCCSIPGKSCSFFIVSLSKDLSQCFMCSDQHVKYWMPRGFPSTSSLLLDYHVKQYRRTRKSEHTHTHRIFSSTMLYSSILVRAPNYPGVLGWVGELICIVQTSDLTT